MSRRNFAWLIGIAAVSLFGFAVSDSAPTSRTRQGLRTGHLLVDVLQEVRTSTSSTWTPSGSGSWSRT